MFAFRMLLRPDLRFRRELDLATEFHGSEYGGWGILRNSLGPDARVISVGIGEDATFDLALMAKYRCTVHAFDPTPKSVRWVRENIRDPNFIFHDEALSDRDGTLRLYLPLRDDFVSASLTPAGKRASRYIDVPAVTLGTLRAQLGFTDTVDVLKMDIEGAEYAVLSDALRSGSLHGVRQLLVEFHHYCPGFSADDTRTAVAALHNAGWRIAWVSPSHHELLFVPPPPAEAPVASS